MFKVKILAKIIPIWATEEYATNIFISFWRIQFILVLIAPIILILINQWFIYLILLIINGINRRIPYPPNFNKTAAKIIDPSSGASTWALGNHKWTKNIGNFIKNANKNISGIKIISFIMISIRKLFLFINKIPNSKGNDPMIV